MMAFAYNSTKHVSKGFSHFMLMYGHPPRSPMMVGLATKKVQKPKDFLQQHFDMLRFTRQQVQQAQASYKKYANEHRRLVSFEGGERVFLKVLEHSQSLKTGLVTELSPRNCEQFTILKRIGQVAYKLATFRAFQISYCLCAKEALILPLFSRTKTFSQGGGNVRTSVLRAGHTGVRPCS